MVKRAQLHEGNELLAEAGPARNVDLAQAQPDANRAQLAADGDVVHETSIVTTA